MTPVLAFDIETVPDVAGIRRLHGLPADLPDAEVAEIAFQRRRTQTGSDFLPPHLQRVVVISCVLREGEGVQVLSLGEPEDGEGDRSSASTTASRSTCRSSCPGTAAASTCRCSTTAGSIHGVTAPKFWDQGDGRHATSATTTTSAATTRGTST